MLLCYFAAPGVPWKNRVLIAASFVFYFWGEQLYILVMIASITIAWMYGIRIENAADDRARRRALAQGIVLVLALLVFFKYTNFLVQNVNRVLPHLGIGWRARLRQIHLPIGISFFTFQVMSYLIDMYRREFPAQRRFWKVALYKTFFPQLIAGPIVRYKTIKNNIDHRHTSGDDFAIGCYRFVTGLAQKVLIANTVGAVADQVFELSSAQLGPAAAWLGAVCYFFQIYYDFAGYSNMAIGMGRIFGFRFLENFEHPYSSQSITEFWRRWHISLSSWFRDYLYIPLGGNRVSPARTYLNLYVVFFLCGLWHGASWNFVIWGLLHGTLLVLERLGLGDFLKQLPSVLRRGYVWLTVIVAWVFFRADTLHHAARYLRAMLTGHSGTAAMPIAAYANPELIIALLVAAWFAFPRTLFVPAEDEVDAATDVPTWRSMMQYAAYASALLLSLVYLAGNSFNPFIYFRF